MRSYFNISRHTCTLHLAGWTNHVLMSQQNTMKPRFKSATCHTISNCVKMENHTWRVRQDRAKLIIMVGPPTKNFQWNPLLLISIKPMRKYTTPHFGRIVIQVLVHKLQCVQMHAHKEGNLRTNTCTVAVQIELPLRMCWALNCIPKAWWTYKHTAAYPWTTVCNPMPCANVLGNQ